MGIKFDKGKDMTKQHAKPRSVREIMEGVARGEKYERSPENGRYGDFSNAPDFRESLESVLRVQKSFEAMPSNVRFAYGNNPENMLIDLDKAKNGDVESIQRCAALGIIKLRRKGEAHKEAAPDPAPAPPAP